MPIPLHEKYRPQPLSDVVGQPQAVKLLDTLINRHYIGGRAFWFSGKTGTGKTTLARIIARSLAHSSCIVEYDSADQFNQAAFDAMAQTLPLLGWPRDGFCGGREFGGRAWIINEAHGLRKPIIRQLLGLLERLPAHCVVIFTTTRAGQESLFDDQIDAHPLLSRCHVIPLTTQGLAKAFAERARTIAQREGINGKPLENYLKLANKHAANLRGMLTEIEDETMLELTP